MTMTDPIDDMQPRRPDPLLVNKLPFREFRSIIGNRLPAPTVLRLFRLGRRVSHDAMMSALRQELRKASLNKFTSAVKSMRFQPAGTR